MRSWARVLLVAAALAASTGCATVFRDSHVKVHVDSDPSGAQARVHQQEAKTTPADVEVERTATNNVVVNKPGFAEHRGLIKKKMNGGWLALDIVTCVIPVALCIPLLVDAISGAWLDVQKSYVAKLEPATNAAAAAATTGTPPPVAPAAPAPTTTGPPADMSESERKATARAAYIEGVQLQEKNNCVEALPRFEVAQKMFSAPTHLLRIAQCQAATGRLVEASETYETLARMQLAKDAPDVFRQAQEEARKELPGLKPRIPTLRVQVTPAPSTLTNLVVTINGSTVPSELLGIARPVNPGTYKIAVHAAGMKAATTELEVKEGVQKTAELKLTK